MKLERDLIKQISNRLSILKMTGEVVWFHRIQSGKVKVGQYYIKLADSGTPDWFALIRNREDGLTGLFLEAKSDKGIISPAQLTWALKHRKKDIHILIVRDIKELDAWIDKYAKNFVDGITL